MATKVYRGLVHESQASTKTEARKVFKRSMPEAKIRKVTKARGGGWSIYWL